MDSRWRRCLRHHLLYSGPPRRPKEDSARCWKRLNWNVPQVSPRTEDASYPTCIPQDRRDPSSEEEHRRYQGKTSVREKSKEEEKGTAADTGYSDRRPWAIFIVRSWWEQQQQRQWRNQEGCRRSFRGKTWQTFLNLHMFIYYNQLLATSVFS